MTVFRHVIYRRQRLRERATVLYCRFPRPVAPSAGASHTGGMYTYRQLQLFTFTPPRASQISARLSARPKPVARSSATLQATCEATSRAHDLPLPAGGRQPTVGGPIGRRPSGAARSSPSVRPEPTTGAYDRSLRPEPTTGAAFRCISVSSRLGTSATRRNSSALSHFPFPHPPPYLIRMFTPVGE